MFSRRSFLAASAAFTVFGSALDLVFKQARAPRLSVFGVGGVGVRALSGLSPELISGAKLVALCTDSDQLAAASVQHRHLLAADTPQARWRRGSSELDRDAAQGEAAVLRQLADGVDHLVLLGGLGETTDARALRVVADGARDAGAVTLAVVTDPFWFEGRQRRARAVDGLKALWAAADLVIPVSNQALLAVRRRGRKLRDAFGDSDRVVNGVAEALAVASMLVGQGLLQPLSDRGQGAAGVGVGAGAMEAVQEALRSPVLEEARRSARTPRPLRQPVEALVHIRGARIGEAAAGKLEELVRRETGVERVVCARSGGGEASCAATVLLLPEQWKGVWGELGWGSAVVPLA